MNILVEWLLRALIILVTSYFVPGFRIDSFTTSLVLVIILGALNLFVKPLLVLFTLPITILTLGLFTFVVNAIVLELAALFVRGVHIDSFLTAIVAAVVISFISSLVNVFFRS